MTPEFGFGMLAMGLVAIFIGAIIAYFIINKAHNENNTDNQFCIFSWLQRKVRWLRSFNRNVQMDINE